MKSINPAGDALRHVDRSSSRATGQGPSFGILLSGVQRNMSQALATFVGIPPPARLTHH
jgi:hypothetical protein